jgi:hypothetical protein
MSAASYKATGNKLLRSLALLAGAYLLLLAAVNLFLSTPIGPWAVNRRPQKLRVTWERAWCLIPGRIHVRGLRVEGHARSVDWWVAAERGSGRIDLPGLFLRRFRVTGFSGDGVRSSTVRRAGPAPARPSRQKRGWRVEMSGVSLTDVRAIGWDEFLLLGGGAARGGFSLITGGDFSLSPTALRMPGARLLRAGETIAQNLDVDTGISISPYAPRQHPGVAGFDFVSGTLRARGKTGAGDLAVDVRLDRGRLAPGSLATLRAGAPLSALLTVETNEAGPQLVLRADGRGLHFGKILAADALHLEAATPETRFSRLLAQGRELRRTGRLADGALVAAFSAAGLRLSSSGADAGQRFSWQLTADHGTGWIDLPALLRRQVLLDRLQADGLGVRIERTRGQPQPPGNGLWTVRLAAARLSGFRELTFQDLRLDGDLEAAGGLALDPDGTLAVDNLALRMADGRLLRDGKTLVRGLHLTTAASLGPYSFRAQPGLAGLDFLSGAVQARGKTAELPFLTLDGRTHRSGDMDLDLRLDHGRLLPGTRVAVFSGKPLRITGEVLEEKPGRSRLVLAAEAKGLTLGGGNGYPPLLRAGSAVLRTDSPELRLRRLLATAEELRAGRLAGAPPTGTPLTGDIDLRALQVNGVGERVVWQLTADRGSGRIDLSALLRRQVLLTAVRVEGAAAQLDPATGPPPVVPFDKRWAVDMQDARIESLRSLAFQAERLAGAGRLEGTLSFDRSRVLTVSRAALTVPAGRLESGGAPVARRIAVRADLRVAPFVPGEIHGTALLRLVSGAVAVQGQVSSLGFLQRYLQKAPWLQVQGQGQLDAEVHLDAGRLLPGSRLGVRGQVRSVFLDSVATGDAVVTGTVQAGKATLGVDFSRFVIAPLPEESSSSIERSYIEGTGLRLGLFSTDLDLATPVSDLRATVDLPDGRVPDLTVYNAYLPPGTGVSLLSGTGRLRLHFDLDAKTQSGEGEVLLSSAATRVRFQNVDLEGNLMLRARLTSRDLKARRFQIAGTRLDLDRVTYREIDEKAGAEPGTESPDWWAHLRITDGSMVWGRPLSLLGVAQVEMKSSGLLLAVFARKKNFLRWFHRLLSIENVRAEGTIRCGDGVIEIAPLRVTGGRFDLRSRLRLSRASKQGEMFLRWGKLATGIELRDGKRTFKLRRPEEWFENGREP